MREKVSTAYFLNDPRKFSSMEDAEKELNRLRAVCVRLKEKQGEEIAFMLGLSVTDSQYMGRMGYQKSMRYGGKKVFICYIIVSSSEIFLSLCDGKYIRMFLLVQRLEYNQTPVCFGIFRQALDF